MQRFLKETRNLLKKLPAFSALSYTVAGNSTTRKGMHMVAPSDLKHGTWVIAPWGKDKIEFRIEKGDLTFAIESGGGVQRRIDICFPVARIPLVQGILIHTVPKKGVASILVAKPLSLPSPKEGSGTLGDTLTFTGQRGPCRADEPSRQLQLGNRVISQRLYRMPHDNSLLLVERHFESRNKPFTCYYQVVQVDEKDLRRK